MALSPNFNVALSSGGTTTLLDSSVDGNCRAFFVYNRGAGYALIHVAGIHPAGYFAPVPPNTGLSFSFGQGQNGITSVTGKSDSTCNIDTSIIASF